MRTDVVVTGWASLRCLNCGAELAGAFCRQCGQKHEPHIHSLRHFAAEAFESLTHADSRLWRTLWLLVSKPGLLTQEFFAGRRARYLPPVRFYLVVSVLFFLLAGLLGSNNAPIVQVDTQSPSERAIGPSSERSDTCDSLKYTGPFQDWVRARLPVQCRKLMADEGRGLTRAFLQNAPKALFVLLPLLAACMMLLYWRPRRHYVVHLLFLLQNHTLMFLGYSVLLLASAPLPDGVSFALPALLFHVWLLWYCYRGMRVVYGQRRWRTLPKYLTMLVAYVLLGGLTLMSTVLFSAATL